jgi:outer membrane protein
LVVDSAILMQDPKAILDKAKQTRTDLKIAQTNVQIAEKDIQIAKGAYEPSVQGFYGFNSRVSYADRIIGVDSSGKPLFSAPLPFFNQFSDNKGQSFGVNLNIPILNGFSVRNNVARSKISLERSKNLLQQQELDLERIVFTAYTDTKGAQKTNEAAISSLEAREKAFNYAKERYEVGLMNVFDFNQAQTLFVNAQSEVLRTKYDYIFRTKILEFYFGIPFIKKS